MASSIRELVDVPNFDLGDGKGRMRNSPNGGRLVRYCKVNDLYYLFDHDDRLICSGERAVVLQQHIKLCDTEDDIRERVEYLTRGRRIRIRDPKSGP